MYLLDTDHLTILERGGPEARPLRVRLAGIPSEEVAATVISYEEQTRGWMSYLAGARSDEAQAQAYRRLREHLRTFCAIPIAEFDRGAVQEWRRLQRLRLRIGTMDLKIAAVALVNDAVVLTRNTGDFGRVPGLQAEDWTK